MALHRLSDALIRALGDATGFGEAEAPDSVCRAVGELSGLFTRDRGALAETYLNDPRLRSAYLSYDLPVNLAKIQSLLEEMPQPACTGSSRSGRSFRVLDVGSGPGTAALAVLDWMRESTERRHQPVEVVSLDRSASALTEGERLWKTYSRLTAAGDCRLATRHMDVTRSDPGRLLAGSDSASYDLIVVANSLNELFRTDRDPVSRRAALVKGLLDLLDDTGTLMIVEPALRDTSRELLRLRDLLLEARACTLYSPCLHHGPCQALVKKDDWCHEERAWAPPAIVAAIDRKVGFIKDALKFSYLLLRKDGLTIVARSPEVFRVVSELRTMKGEKRAWLCNETGRPEVGRQDRMRSDSNAAFDDWHRGAIVRIDQIVRKNQEGGLGRIPVSATVEIIRPV
jgi:SAM-dependent methyltransferase